MKENKQRRRGNDSEAKNEEQPLDHRIRTKTITTAMYITIMIATVMYGIVKICNSYVWENDILQLYSVLCNHMTAALHSIMLNVN